MKKICGSSQMILYNVQCVVCMGVRCSGMRFQRLDIKRNKLVMWVSEASVSNVTNLFYSPFNRFYFRNDSIILLWDVECPASRFSQQKKNKKKKKQMNMARCTHFITNKRISCQSFSLIACVALWGVIIPCSLHNVYCVLCTLYTRKTWYTLFTYIVQHLNKDWYAVHKALLTFFKIHSHFPSWCSMFIQWSTIQREYIVL